jgi:hypothetical protein
MPIFKVVNALLFPFTLVKSRIHGPRLNELKDETIRVINKLVDKPLYDTKDYEVRIGLFEGFTFYHKETGHVLASAGLLNCGYVGIENKDIRSKFFPAEFAQEHSKTLKVSEYLSIRHDENKVYSITSEVVVDQIASTKFFGREHPYRNIITIRLDDQFNIKSIHKKTYNLSEKNGQTLHSKEYPHDKPVDIERMYNISNMFINEKAKSLVGHASEA